MTHVLKGRFIVGNRLAESFERGRQDIDAIEIGAQGVECAIQLALDPIRGCFRSNCPCPMPAALPCVRVKTLGERWFLLSEMSSIPD
jgi:hypothetical protein